MAEPADMTASLLVVAFDPWAMSVARLISRAAPTSGVLDACSYGADTMVVDGVPSARPRVLVMSAGHDEERVASIRAALEAERVTHLTVERDGRSIWVGPTVVPARPGCHGCRQARRRQHSEMLPGEPLGPPPNDPELVRAGARAALAVARRVLASPLDEAGVVRRFTPDGTPHAAGRVVAVTGCARCDDAAPHLAGWSLCDRESAGVAITRTREEVKT